MKQRTLFALLLAFLLLGSSVYAVSNAESNKEENKKNSILISAYELGLFKSRVSVGIWSVKKGVAAATKTIEEQCIRLEKIADNNFKKKVEKQFETQENLDKIKTEISNFCILKDNFSTDMTSDDFSAEIDKTVAVLETNLKPLFVDFRVKARMKLLEDREKKYEPDSLRITVNTLKAYGVLNKQEAKKLKKKATKLKEKIAKAKEEGKNKKPNPIKIRKYMLKAKKLFKKISDTLKGLKK